MCRNPSCDNFGIYYQGPAPDGPGTVKDERYQFSPNTGRFSCKSCDMTFALKSNQAIRPFARYYLKLSLPFADCADTDCANHGINAFEHFTPWRRPKERRYSRDDEHMMLCRLCKKRFHIGEALQMPRERDTKKYIRNIVTGVLEQRTVLSTIDSTYTAPTIYYDRVFRAASRLRDYHAWRNAHLLQPKFSESDEPVRVYTDTQLVSLKKLGKAGRFKNINILVSVIERQKTLYILAAHLEFLPDDYEYFPSSLSDLRCVKIMIFKATPRGARCQPSLAR